MKRNHSRRNKIRNHLKEWFKRNKRFLPWRTDTIPYKILLSEIMLQQTQVNQIKPYYDKFLRIFPTVEALAQSELEDVLMVWQGMGYYSRASNLHKAAQLIVKDYDGKIPNTWEQLSNLPGFGPYTTSAILSIAYNKPYPVIDGNVTRVITRLFGIRDDIRLKNTKSVINRHAQELLDPKQPGIFNEAIMELGATVCRPQSPKCTFCPINELCIANNKNQTNIIPLKSRRGQRVSRMINFYILKYEKSFLLVKRPQKGLLAGLWEFPASQIISEGNNPGKLIFPEWMNIREKPQKVWQPIKHTYTHFNATYHPYLFIINNRDFIPAGYEEHKWISLAEIARLPIHRAMQKTVEKISSDLEIIA